jgi:hypothetical protein
MASQSEAIVQRIRQKRHDIAADLDQLNQSILAKYEQATDWRQLIRRNAVRATAGMLIAGLLLGLAVGNWREH